jgi:hypothetical protein
MCVCVYLSPLVINVAHTKQLPDFQTYLRYNHVIEQSLIPFLNFVLPPITNKIFQFNAKQKLAYNNHMIQIVISRSLS